MLHPTPRPPALCAVGAVKERWTSEAMAAMAAQGSPTSSSRCLHYRLRLGRELRGWWLLAELASLALLVWPSLSLLGSLLRSEMGGADSLSRDAVRTQSVLFTH